YSKKNSETLSIDYCLIISIIDPTNEKDVYSETIRSLDKYNFIHESIKTEIDTHINNGLES
ncbi:hypothetical protein EFC28_15465, partial [Listeria monocytogenes]|nr:hypothetical protein [Listeria monocytogenes]